MSHKSFLSCIICDEQLINLIKLNDKFRKEIKRIRNKYHLPPNGIVLSLQTRDKNIGKLAKQQVKHLYKNGNIIKKEEYAKIKNKISLTYSNQNLSPVILNNNYPHELIDKCGNGFINDIDSVVDNLLVRCNLTNRWRETIKQMILFTSAPSPDPTIQFCKYALKSKGRPKISICLKIYTDAKKEDLNAWWPAIRKNKDNIDDKEYQNYQIKNNKYEIIYEDDRSPWYLDDYIYLRINKNTDKEDIINIWEDQIKKLIKNKRGYKARLKFSAILKENVKLIYPNDKDKSNRELAEMLWGKIKTKDKYKKRKLEEARIKSIKKRKNRIKKKINSICV